MTEEDGLDHPEMKTLWHDLGDLPQPEPSPALRARFYQQLNALDRPAQPQKPFWRMFQVTAAAALFVAGIAVGRLNFQSVQSKEAAQLKEAAQPKEVVELKTEVEGLRQTVALSLMTKESASSRLQGIEWSSQVTQPDQELLGALLTTLNQDPNINVRLASLDALENFTADSGVRQALELSIRKQNSPLLQIALIDALVHAHDNGAAKEFKQLSGNQSINASVRERAHWAVEKLSQE